MKKLISIILFSMLALSLSAQNGKPHLKFMGIPLCLNIDDFDSELTYVKGAKLDTDNKDNNSGTRWYTGKFCGQDVSIYAYYDTTTRFVYRAKAVKFGKTKSALESFRNNIEEAIRKKYHTKEFRFDFAEDVNDDGLSVNTYTIQQYYYKKTYTIGKIELYMMKHNDGSYSLHIDYTDNYNNNVKQQTFNPDDV